MNILVDENIPLARELFGPLGDVVLVAGRSVDEDYPGLDGFDALAIRSVTRITPALVDRAVGLRFIGTATIGADHIDVAYIQDASRRRASPIEVASAPGSNADSVADYVWYVLGHLTSGAPEPLSARTLGIVGHGNCGSRVARRAEGFGVKMLRCDPPLAERDPSFVSDAFEETLAADFVTLHVPLTREGESEYPTHHMIGARELAQMGSGAYLLNSSRGAVVDSEALVRALRQGAISGAALDVYEGEPEPPEDLIRLPVLATPHIAGYAIEAKRRGAVVVCEAMCRAFGVEPQDTRSLMMRGFNPETGVEVEFAPAGSIAAGADAAVRALLKAASDVEATSRELKATLAYEARGRAFDGMRKSYERDYGRHELAVYRVGSDESVAPDLREQIERRLAGFGMNVTDACPHFVLKPR